MKKVFYVLFFLLLTETSFGQISSISGIINTYTKVTAVDPTCNKVTVQSYVGFSVGDTVLLIQMKGTTVVQTNTATFGDITAIGSAGNYEFAEIAAINTGTNQITLKHTFKTYDVGGSLQMISVPQYTDVEIVGTLTAQAWDGNTGGVLVFEASGTVTMSADIDVSEKGFRGGDLNLSPTSGSSSCFTSSNTTYFYPSSSYNAGRKGESIAAFPTGYESGRGKFANGGGGGNSHNTGGGGGGNYGAGGRGGDKDEKCVPNIFGTPPNPWGYGGIGLYPTYYPSTNKIFLGGGGGSGHNNNLRGFPGGNGGGIVIIEANSMNGNGHLIKSTGGSVAKNWIDNGDGNGGGGAGGTVLLSIPNYTSALTINVSGGNGGDTDNLGNPTSQKDFGPGGGGGGGIVWVSPASLPAQITATVTGGNPGTSLYSGTSYFAVAGTTGGTATGFVLQKGSAVFGGCPSLPVELLTFSAKRLNEKIKLQWITANEKDNSFFTIERTSDLSNFTLVGTTKGSYTSTEAVSYFMYDDYPLNGSSYYRLSQTDIDGTTKVIGVACVTYGLQSEKLIQTIYPLPFENELSLQLNTELVSPDAEANIKIFNALGELFYESTQKISTNLSLSLPELPAGIYTIVVQCDDHMEVSKILKGK